MTIGVRTVTIQRLAMCDVYAGKLHRRGLWAGLGDPLVLTEITAHLTKLKGPPPHCWLVVPLRLAQAANRTIASGQEPERKERAFANELADLLWCLACYRARPRGD